MEDSRDDETSDSESQETSGCLGDRDVEELFLTFQASEEKAHSHDEQEIGQHTPYQGRLDNRDFTVDQGDDADDKLNSVTASESIMAQARVSQPSSPKRRIQQATQSFADSQ